jgi:hypothetical protein
MRCWNPSADQPTCAASTGQDEYFCKKQGKADKGMPKRLSASCIASRSNTQTPPAPSLKRCIESTSGTAAHGNAA